MSDHAPRHIQRHCDVVVIGGSAAGLAAALQLGRQRRSVIVVDAGEPRNAPAAQMHGYLGHEAAAPSTLTAIGAEEVRSYGGEVVSGKAIHVRRTDDGRFDVALTGGHSIIARCVLAATGLVDVLPDIEGLAEQWGRGVIHCPFCHGFEVRDQNVVQILTHPLGLHPATLFAHLTRQLTIVLHEPVHRDDPTLAALRSAGTEIVDARVRKVLNADGRVHAVELEDGRLLDAHAVIVTTRFKPRIEPFAALGLRMTDHVSGLGSGIEVDMRGATSVPGLYAAGNVCDPSQQVLHAAADGSRVGAMISYDLAAADLGARPQHLSNEADWDHRYGEAQLWSGNPNGALVAEAASLTPGRALDVGAGEGGDAIWLAEHGWQVTANDISQRALDRAAAEAQRRGLDIDCLHADANASTPFPRGAFDLVTAHYASIPRTSDMRAVTSLLDAVAPGGTLLVVSHDLEAMRTRIDTSRHSRPFDPDAYVRTDDVAAVIATRSDWSIEIHDKRPRPPGAASASHHVDDIILRARRSD
jgi:thioredoxin reductase/SAM-dependent methyltransferase